MNANAFAATPLFTLWDAGDLVFEHVDGREGVEQAGLDQTAAMQCLERCRTGLSLFYVVRLRCLPPIARGDEPAAGGPRTEEVVAAAEVTATYILRSVWAKRGAPGDLRARVIAELTEAVAMCQSLGRSVAMDVFDQTALDMPATVSSADGVAALHETPPARRSDGIFPEGCVFASESGIARGLAAIAERSRARRAHASAGGVSD